MADTLAAANEAAFREALEACMPWVAASARGAAQEALADACELLGINPLGWSAHPEVLLRRRPELDRRHVGPESTGVAASDRTSNVEGPAVGPESGVTGREGP